MALKAGRVGVAPDQVDEFGKINSEATSGYTKQEADAKFETQTHAASTYETKSDATTALAAKQPKTLAVPIEMLSGTKLTVESALQGLNDAVFVKRALSNVDLNDIIEYGVYSIQTGVTHNPENVAYATMFVTPISGLNGDSRKQIIFADSVMYVRSKVGSPAAWGSWYKYTGSIVS